MSMYYVLFMYKLQYNMCYYKLWDDSVVYRMSNGLLYSHFTRKGAFKIWVGTYVHTT